MMIPSPSPSTGPVKVKVKFPKLYRKQRDLLFHPARFVWIEGSTKSGKTHGCLSWILYQAFKAAEGSALWWVAPIYPQAKIAFRRARKYLPRELVTVNKADLTIEIKGAGTIFFKSADNPDGLYGEDVVAVVFDEASRAKAEAWDAVRSTLTATRGLCRIIGNVRGRKNWMFKGCRRAEGLPGHHYGKLTAWDAVAGGILAREEILEAKAVLDSHVFAELYECNPADDATNPFGYDRIRACVTGELSSLPPVVWGVDLAKSRDYTVAIGLDESGDVCRLERWRLSWEETTDRLVELLDGVPALVDSTGVGDPIVERLQSVNPDVEGFRFSSQSKQGLMEGLAVAIGRREIGYPAGVIVEELEVFEYTHTRTGVRYEAQEGLHDDAVCALALAWRLFETLLKFKPPQAPVQTAPRSPSKYKMRH